MTQTNITRLDDDFQLTTEEFFEISRALQEKHSIFYKFWEIGAPTFTKAIPTACVTFDKEGYNTGFLFNPVFWKDLDQYSRNFVISHEMLHVILNHGARIKDAKHKQIANVALDVVINHTLVNKFGFDRKRVKDADKYCWVDTVFKNEKVPVENDKAFEFYYKKLIKLAEENGLKMKAKMKGQAGGGGSGGGSGDPSDEEGEYDLPELVDIHDDLDDAEFDNIVKELNDMLSDEEKNDKLKEVVEQHFQQDPKDGKSGAMPDSSENPGGKQAGTGTGGWSFIDPRVLKVKKKKKWETVIKKWAMPFLKSDFRDVEQWAREHRRLTAFKQQTNVDTTGIMLPSEVDMEDMYEETQRIEVYFFLDTSGSCIGLKDRFFAAAASLPDDKFSVRLFNFDTAVYETTLESRKVYGGGGTCFNIIEQHIQGIMKKEKVPYPKAVFIITDGYGTQVKPQKEEVWHWFLSENYIHCIPKKSQRYMLKDFE